MFTEKGVIVVENSGIDEDKLMDDCLEAGASDFNADEDVCAVETEPLDLRKVRIALEEKGYKIASSEVERIPANYVHLDDEEDCKKMQLILDSLEDDDDVQNVWHNWENPAEEEEE